MPKSIYAIAGLGIAGCIMLSLMMKNLVQVQQQHRSASPQLQQLLEVKFAAQLVTPLQLREETLNGSVRIVAAACVTAGLKKDRFAEAVGATIWQQVPDTKAKEVEVLVSDERGGTAVSFVFARPTVTPPPPPPK